MIEMRTHMLARTLKIPPATAATLEAQRIMKWRLARRKDLASKFPRCCTVQPRLVLNRNSAVIFTDFEPVGYL
jgi:hypothetical protein